MGRHVRLRAREQPHLNMSGLRDAQFDYDPLPLLSNSGGSACLNQDRLAPSEDHPKIGSLYRRLGLRGCLTSC
jgi:hypothetical protein